MFDLLFAAPALSSFEQREVRVLRSLRLWAVMRRSGQCPMQAVAGTLGSLRAAAHFHLLLEEVGTAWPEPFALSPLCCPRLTHDEALLANMLAHAAAGDWPGFDRLTGEMLDGDARERLFLSLKVLSGAMGRQG